MANYSLPLMSKTCAYPLGRRGIRLYDPAFLFGCVVFFADLFLNKLYDGNYAELALLMGLVIVCLKRPNLRSDGLPVSMLMAIIALGAISFVAEVVNQGDQMVAIRSLVKMMSLFLIIFLYCNIRHPQFALRFVVGFIVGSGLFCLGFIVFEGVVQELKYIVMLPGGFIFLALVLKPILDRIVFFFLLLCGIVFWIVAFEISARSQVISVFVILLFYLAARIVRVKSFIFSPFITLLPFLPVLIANSFGLWLWLVRNGYETASNVERTLMLVSGWQIIQNHPWLGIGSQYFLSTFQAQYGALLKMESVVHGAHHYYLEIAIPYGLISLVIVLFFWWRVYCQAMAWAVVSWPAQAAGMGLLAFMFASNPLSGYARLVAVAIMFVLLAPFPLRRIET